MAWSYNDAQKWGNFDPYSYKAGGSWDDLVNYAKRDWQTQYERSTGSFDPFTGGLTRIGSTSSQIYLDGNADDPWSNAVFNTKTGNTPDGYISRLYRKNDGTIGETFYQEQKGMAGVPWGAFAVLAAPFAVSAMGAGAAGAGAAEGAAAASGAGAAGAGAAGAGEAAAGLGGWISAEGGAGYLGGMAADASALGAAGGAAASGAGWTSGYDLAGGSALPSGSSNALSGLLSKAGEKAASMGITDWINLAGTAANYLGSQKAADAQIGASRDAIAESRRQYDTTRADQLALLARQEAMQKPWYDSGLSALNKLNAGNFDITQDPSYQFRLDQGMKALQNSAAARGGLLSGASMKGITDYSQGLASTEYGNAWNRLASLAGVGQTAANNINQAGSSAYGTIANAGANSSAGIQNSLIGAGNARASGYVGGINAINQGVGQWYNNSQTNRLLDLYAQKNGLIG